MSPKFRSRVIELSALLVLGLTVALAVPSAYAGMISTEAVQAPEGDRERVKAMLARPEVAAEMQKMGIAPGDAAARVDAMSDAEVRTLAGRLDAMPAGGELSTQEWLLVILAILLVIIIL
jgi:hypothetical protein